MAKTNLKALQLHKDEKDYRIDVNMFLKDVKNLQVRGNIWKELPPSPHEFIHSPDFLNRPNLYPSIQEDLEIIFSGPNYAPICEVFLDDEGLGSGKSTKMAIITSYMITRLLFLKNIEEYFHLEHGISRLAVYNMAPNANVAKDVVFVRYQTMLEGMKWFRDNNIMIDKGTTSQIVFTNHPLVIRPGNSSRSFAVGYDTYICVIDECAADEGFETRDKDHFQDLFEGANERRRSRFIDCPEKGMIVCGSSAGTEERYFEKLITEVEELYDQQPEKKCKTDPVEHECGLVMYRRKSAFEANPKYVSFLEAGDYFNYTVVRQPKPDKKITYELKIPNTFKRRFDTNPAKLIRNMCAIPSLAISPFFTEWEKVLACVNSSGRIDPYPQNRSTKRIDEYGYLNEIDPPSVWRDLPDDFHGTNGILYYAHVDLALSGDGCGIAIGHRSADLVKDNIRYPRVVIDLSLCFQGSNENRIKIAEVKQFVIDLAQKRGFRFAKITFDNFQSAQTIQELQDLGFLVEKKGVKKSAFETLMELMYDQRLDWYYDEWALSEMKRLEDKGKVVEKSMGSTDDEIECVARVCEESLLGQVPENVLHSERAHGFSSKGPMASRMTQHITSPLERLNPQLSKQFIKPGFGFASGGYRKR